MTTSPFNSESFPSVAVVGNYLPRVCGIATFTTDLVQALKGEMPDDRISVLAMDDIPEGYDYPSRVKFQLQAQATEDYSTATDFLNSHATDLVMVQHEYGIFGGAAGEYLLPMLKNLRMPVVTTMHTVLSQPNDDQFRVTKGLIEASSRLVVMSHYARKILTSIYGADPDKTVMIPHGIPALPFTDPNYYKDLFGVEGRDVILTFGLLSPTKNIEVVLHALPAIVKRHPRAVYIVLGATHPQVKRLYGEEYRDSLVALTKKLGMEDHVIFVDRFVAQEELCEYIGAADLYVTPYSNTEQITSGTLSYALGAGNAIISTPYRYAEELLGEGRGVLFPVGDHQALAHEINRLFDNPAERHGIRKKAYHYGKSMRWSAVAQSYLQLFQEVNEEETTSPKVNIVTPSKVEDKEDLPAVNLRHLHAMTDDTGMLQHATFTIANREHGYCTDDNARALIAVAKDYALRRDDSAIPLAQTYLAFLLSAFNKKRGCFRNFLSYERTWLEEVGSDDSHARAMWGLGVAASSALPGPLVQLSSNLFVKALPAVTNFPAPRSWAFSLIGIDAYLKKIHGDVFVKGIRTILAHKLHNAFKNHGTPEWPWCEDTLTYANARLPEALIATGKALPHAEMVDTGLKALQWLIDEQTATTGHISIIGNKGWKQRGEATAKFDQQPIDAHALVEACSTAYAVTGDSRWVDEAMRCFNWFLGSNDLETPIADLDIGGCHDGLRKGGLNENQGAESTLAWLLSLLTMHSLPNPSPVASFEEEKNHRGTETQRKG